MQQQYFVQQPYYVQVRPAAAATQHIAPLSKCTFLYGLSNVIIDWLCQNSNLCCIDTLISIDTGVTGAPNTPISSHQQQSHQMSQQIHIQPQYVMPRQTQVIYIDYSNYYIDNR